MQQLIDPLAEVRGLERQALQIQSEIEVLKGQVIDCLRQELDRIAQQAVAVGQLRRDGRSIGRRIADFILRRDRRRDRPVTPPPPPQNPAPADRAAPFEAAVIPPSSCYDPLDRQLAQKRTDLADIERRLIFAYAQLLQTHPNNAHLTGAIKLYQVASCVRKEFYPSHTMIPDLIGCEGGIVEDMVLFDYADHWGSSAFERITTDSLPRYVNQPQCQSELQAVIFNHLLAECVEKVSIPERDPAKCDYLTALINPLLIAADSVLYTGPKTIQWIEGHRRDLLSCVQSNQKFASLGFWFHNLKTGTLDQCKACGPPVEARIRTDEEIPCQKGVDFIWSMNKRNLGMGDCSLGEMCASEPVEGEGYVCATGLCREAAVVAGRARRAADQSRRRVPAAIPEIPEANPARAPLDEEDLSGKTPFGMDVEELREALCPRLGNLRAPPMVPPCAHILPGYYPENSSLFECQTTEGIESLMGVKSSPSCQVSTQSQLPGPDSLEPPPGEEEGGEEGDEEEEGGEEGDEEEEGGGGGSDENEENKKGSSGYSSRKEGGSGRGGGAERRSGHGGGREPAFGGGESSVMDRARVTASAVIREAGFQQVVTRIATALGMVPPRWGAFEIAAGATAIAIESLTPIDCRIGGATPSDACSGFGSNDGLHVTSVTMAAYCPAGLDTCVSAMLREAVNLVLTLERTLGLREEGRTLRTDAFSQDFLGQAGQRPWNAAGRARAVFDWLYGGRGARRGGGARSCGEEGCSDSCTPGVQKILRMGECLVSRISRPPPQPVCNDPRCRFARPDGPGGDLPADPRANRGACFPGGILTGLGSDACADRQCPEGQVPVAHYGGTCSCQTPGSRGGGGPVGPLDCDDLGPRDPRCPRGGEGPGGPGGGDFNPRGLPGGGGTPVIPGGGNNPAEGR